MKTEYEKWEDEQVADALAFATYHHAAIGQKRKYTDDDYIVHPIAVMEIVRSVPHTIAMLKASILHDTVEDTNATLDDIREKFGNEVYELVEMLTDVSKPEDGNRAFRKDKDLQHTAIASTAAKTIKLADLLHNSVSILKYDAGFAKVFITEKSALLSVLSEGDTTLYNRALKVIEKYKESK